MWDFLQSIYNLYEFIAVCFFIPVTAIMVYLMFAMDKQGSEIIELEKEIRRLKEEA